MKKEENELIAEFMGLPYKQTIGQSYYNRKNPDNTGTWYNIKGMKYSTSWDWLMTVVEKIERTWEVSFLRVMDFYIDYTGWNGKHTKVCISIMLLKSGNPYHYIRTDHENKLQAVYDAIIQFIEWYNLNKQLTP